MENTLREQIKELVKKLKKNIEDFVTAQVAEFEKETGREFWPNRPEDTVRVERARDVEAESQALLFVEAMIAGARAGTLTDLTKEAQNES